MRRLSLVILVAVVVAGTVVPVDSAAAFGEPSVTVHLDGEELADGGERIVASDPSLTVNATGRTSVQRVIVRLDGGTVASYAPGTETFEKTLELHLQNRPQELQVVMRGSDGSVVTHRSTVQKDAVAPFMGFDEPFESETGTRPPAEIPLSKSRVTLAGEVVDTIGVDSLEIVRRHRYERAGDVRVTRKSRTIEDPGRNFSTEVFFGIGENELTVRARDEFGYTREYTMTVFVEDSQEPTVELETLPETTKSPTVVLRGTASDNVQVGSVSYGNLGKVNEKSIHINQGSGADPARESLSFAEEIELQPGENRITVWVTDVDGNEAKETAVVEYDRNVVPTLSIDEGRTHITEGVIHVYGAARDGRVRSVSVESVGPDGRVQDYQQVYEGGEVWNDLSFSEELDAVEGGPTTVVVRAVDVDGTEHVTRYRVEASQPTATPEPTASGEATPEATPDAEPEPTPAESADTESRDEPVASTTVQDGGFGAFAVSALLLVLGSFARLRGVTVEVPTDGVDLEFDLDLPKLRR